LIIYANKERLKVKKAGLKCTFSKWEDYLRSQLITLKDCNLIEGAAQYRDMFFDVTEVDGDRIKVKSVQDCGGLGKEVSHWKDG
jgi:recombinational DNA repair ATPase RecF